MCYAAGLTAQQADQDQPNEPPDSSESASSAIAPAPIYAPLDRTQKYFYSFNEMAGPTQWIGFAVHAAMDQARKSPGGEWSLHVEAVPAPRTPSWPEPPTSEGGWGVAAPADAEALGASGALLGNGLLARST